MARVSILASALTLVLVLAAANAHAHDPDWQEPAAPPVPLPETLPERLPDATAAAQPVEDLPDLYAAERKWGGMIGGGVAYFIPYDGVGGPGANIQGAAVSPKGHWRIGAELYHRDYQTTFFNLPKIDIDTYEINAFFHWLPYPDKFATPYIGAGLGLNINSIDADEVMRKDPGLTVDDDTGVGFGLFAIAGVEVPLGKYLALYAEGRVSIGYQNITFENQNGRIIRKEENTGGGSGLAGIRIKF